jgi:hypothetical protein
MFHYTETNYYRREPKKQQQPWRIPLAGGAQQTKMATQIQEQDKKPYSLPQYILLTSQGGEEAFIHMKHKKRPTTRKENPKHKKTSFSYLSFTLPQKKKTPQSISADRSDLYILLQSSTRIIINHPSKNHPPVRHFYGSRRLKTDYALSQ